MAENDQKKSVLGRGFDSLISSDFDKSLISSSERIEKITVDKLRSNPHQPRSNFDEKALAELAESINQHGIIQPLVVTPEKDGIYTIIAGERRWRAAIIAGLKEVPAVLRTTQELEQLEIALIENVQRVDLNPLEQAVSVERLHDMFSLSYEDIAKRLGKAPSTISNIARLMNLPDDAKEALINNLISEGHARAILALKGDKVRQDYLLKTIIAQKWNVRQAERFVVSVKEGIKETEKATARTKDETPETIKLSHRIKAPVYIRRTAYGGRLEITFQSDDDLKRILKLFKKS